MATLVINNQKGGVGKTNLAVHCAWFLAERRASVLLLDLDPQANASYSLAEATRLDPSSRLFDTAPLRELRPEPGISLMPADHTLDTVDARLTEAVGAFRGHYAAVEAAFDYVIIDTPPNWSGRNYAALMVATSLVAPIDLETYALQGVQQLLSQKQTVERNARGGRPIDFLGLLPSRYVSTSPRQRRHLETLVRQDTRRLLFPDQHLLTQRQGYAEALDERQPVWTLRKTAAQEAGREILGVLGVIKTRLDQLSGRPA